MKKPLSVIIIFFMALAFGAAGGDQLVMESLTPVKAKAFMRSGKISSVIRSVNNFMKTSMTDEQKKEILKDVDEFRNKTGIDPLNAGSLEEAGIDTDRPFGFAYVDKTQVEEKMMVFIPVLNGKTFPLKFVQIVKSMKKDTPEMDVYPVITSYKEYSIYQVQKDVFCTAIQDYFIITSRGELVREAIDLVMNTESSLAADSLYVDYMNKSRNGNDMNIFARRDVLMEMAASFQKEFNKGQKGPRGGEFEGMPQGKNGNYPGMDNSGMTEFSTVPVMYPVEDGGSGGGSSSLQALDYAVLGFDLESNKIQVQVGASFNGSDPMVSSIVNLLKPGSSGDALYPTAAVMYSYLGLDLSKLEGMCKQPLPFCAQYAAFKKEVLDDYGIDVSREFIPYSPGVFNMMVGNPAIGEYAVFLPMNDVKKIQSINVKMQAFLKKKHGPANRYGTVTVGKNKGCWFFDKNNKKQFMITDNRGIYMSSSEEFLGKALKEKNIKGMKGGELMKKLNKDVFFLTYIQKNMFLTALLQSQAKGNKQLSQATSSIGDIYLSGSRNGNYISVDLDVAMEIVPAR